ncbi:MAG: (2Fe-2S)-binding protein [Solirubrobacterales bacterium]|nr:(2Fe-2S)-binding protein [Solirubrobacterales bacterium]
MSLTLNGRPQRLDVPEHWTLLRALRDGVGATDVKYGCGEGVCGACTVLLDGAAVNSCSVIVAQVDGCEVETVSGLARDGELHPLQRELVSRGAVQCGFCIPGVMLSALEAVRLNAASTRAEIRESLVGNICRCTGYVRIVDAVEAYGATAEQPREAAL